MSKPILKNFKIGSICQLYPGDTHTKMVKILDINELGFEFEMVKGTSEKADYQIGDVIFINHAKNITLKLIR